jgi:NAD(P)-dependent dehydrogenase (short-subunit alcohol dehydrogenase family)
VNWEAVALVGAAAPASVAIHGSGELAEGLRTAAQAVGIDVADAGNAKLILIACEAAGSDAVASHLSYLKAVQEVAASDVPVLLVDTVDPETPGMETAWTGGASGLAKTAAREWPDRRIAIAHVPQAEAETLTTLLNAALSLPIECIIRERTVLEAQLTDEIAPAPGNAVTAGDVFLVTGGARGVTADCVIALARHSGARFVLAGRSEMTDWPADIPPTDDLAQLRAALLAAARVRSETVTPRAIDRQARALIAGQEIRQTLAAIREAGAEAQYVAADISDGHGAEAAIAAAKARFGRITGVIHGAGVLADKRIEDKTEEQVARVFAPKVEGLRHLLDRLDADELKHVALFSSVAARFGNAGQADYAMANEVLNRVARALKAERPARTVVSFNWGPWDGGMVSPELARHFAEQGVSLLSREAGAAAFARLMAMGALAPTEIVVAG